MTSAQRRARPAAHARVRARRTREGVRREARDRVDARRPARSATRRRCRARRRAPDRGRAPPSRRAARRSRRSARRRRPRSRIGGVRSSDAWERARSTRLPSPSRRSMPAHVDRDADATRPPSLATSSTRPGESPCEHRVRRRGAAPRQRRAGRAGRGARARLPRRPERRARRGARRAGTRSTNAERRRAGSARRPAGRRRRRRRGRPRDRRECASTSSARAGLATPTRGRSAQQRRRAYSSQPHWIHRNGVSVEQRLAARVALGGGADERSPGDVRDDARLQELVGDGARRRSRIALRASLRRREARRPRARRPPCPRSSSRLHPTAASASALAQVVAAVVAGEVERRAKARLVREGQRRARASRASDAPTAAPARAMRKRNVVSRSALGRSERRAMSSSVGRVVGGGGGGAPRAAASVSRERPGDERPRRARARRAGHGARLRLFEGRQVARLARPPRPGRASDRGAARRRGAPTSAGPTCFAIGSARTSGTKSSTHIEMRWLSLIIGASCARSAPLDSPRATRASSAPNARCDWRLAATFARSGESSGSREKHAALSAAGPPASSPDERLTQQRPRPADPAPRRARGGRTRRARAGARRAG